MKPECSNEDLYLMKATSSPTAKVLSFVQTGVPKEMEWGDEWREVFKKAREVAYDKNADPVAREYWCAIVEGRADDAAEVLRRVWRSSP